LIRDYNQYQYTKKEKIKIYIQGSLIVFILGILFYQNIIGILILSPIIYYYKRIKTKTLINKRKWQLNLEFRDGIAALSASLEAGYSTENAFEQACKDLRLIYKQDSMIIIEFSYILNQIRMNITVEAALNDFADRSGIEDIECFAEVFNTAKRTGGDLINVIKITNQSINDKIEVKREIVTIISAKRLEANIMKGIPLFILFYLSITSPGFLDPLYNNLLGMMFMTVILTVYGGATLLIDKIVSIEV
jgi:Flp pilus assembly protein TadB